MNIEQIPLSDSYAVHIPLQLKSDPMYGIPRFESLPFGSMRIKWIRVGGQLVAVITFRRR
jgi:hypothetical protein